MLGHLQYVETLHGENVKNCSFPAIDYCRIIMALLVLMIHYPPLNSFSGELNYFITQYIARLAVPFFFCCNGYFLYRTDDSEKQLSAKISRSVAKAWKMYVFWTVIYSPIIVYTLLKTVVKGQDSLLRVILRKVRDVLLVGSYTQLWYLLGLCVALFLLRIIHIWQHVGWRKIYGIAIALYAVGLLYDGYIRTQYNWSDWKTSWVGVLLKLYRGTFQETRNGIFFGFPFLILGIMIARKKTFQTRKFYLGMFLVSLALGATEVFLRLRMMDYNLERGCNMYAFLVPAIYSLICLLLQCKVNTNDTTASIRKFSSLFFLTHMWIAFIYTTFYYKVLGAPKFSLSSLVGFIVVAIITSGCCIVIISVSKKPHFAWIRKYY